MLQFSTFQLNVNQFTRDDATPAFEYPAYDDSGTARSFLSKIRPDSTPARFQLSSHLKYSCRTLVPQAPKCHIAAFASASSTLWQHVRPAPTEALLSGRDASGKGVIFEEDLESFAQGAGLPSGYGRLFIEALQGPSSRVLMHVDAAARDASLKKFSNFVNSRETALNKAFRAFDQDKDGKISLEDLEGTLTYISIACPKTRCVYRCRRQVVKQLLSRVKLDGNRPVQFEEFKKFFLMLPQNEMMVEYWLSARCVGICDVDTKVRVHEDHKGSPWGHLFAGAVAGAASRTATAPLETLRLAAMAGTLPSANLAVATSTILAKDGIRGLYRGNLLNVIRSAPQKACDFFAFDMYKQLLGTSTPATTLLAAGMAGATSWVILYPLEVVRSRITCDTQGQYKGIIHAFQTIIAKEGPQQLVRGIGPSVAAIIPEAAICYGLQDLLKQAYRNINDGKEPSVPLSMGMGVFSAFMGQLVSFPLEAISRRMQVSSCNQDVMCVIRELMKQGGLPAFYKGVGASTLRLVPMALVSFGAYEATRHMLMQMEDKQRKATFEKENEQAMAEAQSTPESNTAQPQGQGTTALQCKRHGPACMLTGEGHSDAED